MSRWSAYTQTPKFANWRSFVLVKVAADWGRTAKHMDGWASGWITATVILLGFGITVTRWTQPDVYGDGGVA